MEKTHTILSCKINTKYTEYEYNEQNKSSLFANIDINYALS